MRALIRMIALAVLALAVPLDAARASLAPSVQACACGCGSSLDCPCGCGSAPVNLPRSGSNGPCHSTTLPLPVAEAARSMTWAGLASESRQPLPRRAEPRPWPLSWPSAHRGQGPIALAPVLPRQDGDAGPPRARLAKLAAFRI